MLRVEPLDSLSLQRSDYRVVRVEHVAEHRVAIVNRRRWSWSSSTAYILVRVQIDVLNGRQRQRTDLYRLGSCHVSDVGVDGASER